MRTINSFVIALDVSGKILRKTDIVLDRWEVVTDEGFSAVAERNRLAAKRLATDIDQSKRIES